MTFTIFQVLLTSFFIFGLYEITREDKILSTFYKITTHKGENTFSLSKPFIECPVCMSSLYGFLAYFYFQQQRPSIDDTIWVLMASIFLSSLVEIHFTWNISDELFKGLRTAKFWASKVSMSLYTFLVSYILIKNGNIDCGIFIVCVAGLNSILETLVLSLKHKEKLVEVETDKVSVITRIGQELLNKN